MIGKTISHYTISARIGSGAMGEVYKADDLVLKRSVALKFLSDDLVLDERFKKRFIREARAASALDHPNVCTIYEISETAEGRLYIAMCYYEGKSLRDRLSRGPLPVASALEYALGIADGLDAAHKKDILHRDIKPANIHVTNEGAVKILDFGLAKLSGVSKVTKTGTSLGTLAYMSPEQVRGEALDARSDIFSFGTMLYEMVTGTCPFVADNEAAIVYKILNENPTPVRSIRSEIPERLASIIEKSMSKECSRRYRSMAELHNDLLDILREIAPSRVIRFESRIRQRAYHAKNTVKRTLIALFIAAVCILAVIKWNAVYRMFGFGGLGDTKGIAVLPFEASDDQSDDAIFAMGFTEDLTRRIHRMAEYDQSLWVVPSTRMPNKASIKPEQVRNSFGVDAILTGSIRNAASGYILDIRLLNAHTLAQIDAIEISAAQNGSWHASLDGRLAELLGLEIDSSQIALLRAGGTSSATAFESYITGLGLLASDEDALIEPALSAFRQSIATDSLFSDAYIECSRIWLRDATAAEGDLSARNAMTACNKALHLDSLNAGVFTLRGDITFVLGKKESAVRDFVRAAVLRPRDHIIAHKLGWAYFKLGQYEKAEEVYRETIESNPYYWGGCEDLGYLYYVLGRFEDAILQFQRVAQLAPDHAPTYNYLGANYYYLDRWDEAIKLFEKSFSLGKNYQACTNLGFFYYMQERFEEAAQMHEWAWEYDRSNHLVIGNLVAALYWIPGERERAVSLCRQATALALQELRGTPDDAVLFSVIAGYYALIIPDSAAYYVERALGLEKSNAEVLYRAAQVFEHLGHRAKALVLLGDAINNGYSVKEIMHERQFKELREDSRFDLLVSERR